MRYSEVKPGMELVYYNLTHFYMVIIKSINYHEAVLDGIEITNRGKKITFNIFKNRVKNGGVWDKTSKYLQLDDFEKRHRHYAFQLIFR